MKSVRAFGIGRRMPGSFPAVPASRWAVASAALLWLLVGLLMAAVSLKLWQGQGFEPVPGAPLPSVAASTDGVARALGWRVDTVPSDQAPPPQTARFRLLGWVDQGRSGGAALISVDGKPARPFAVGAPVVDEWSLRSIQESVAVLGSARSSTSFLELRLPTPPEALP